MNDQTKHGTRVNPYTFGLNRISPNLTMVWGWNQKMIPAEWNYVERIISSIYSLKNRNLICKFHKIGSKNKANVCRVGVLYYHEEWGDCMLELSIILPRRIRRMYSRAEYYITSKNEANVFQGGVLYYLEE